VLETELAKTINMCNNFDVDRLLLTAAVASLDTTA